MPPEFYDKRGQLTAYALACGYIVRRENYQTGYTVTMWQEHGVYHVRTNTVATARQVIWDTATTLTGARAALARQLREYIR